MNKIEVCWWALTHHDRKLAEILLRSLSHVVAISDDLILDALLFRHKFKKRDLSYADSIGYCLARKHKLRFLTGDKRFKNLPGVEFVK